MRALTNDDGNLLCKLRPAAFLALGLAAFSIGAADANSISEEEAHAIGVEAYVYFYPLLSMDITRKQLTNVEAKKGAIGGPSNQFNNILEFPPADMKVVVRPNFDTLYSSAWLDLTKEPVVVSAPDTGGRFYLLPMLDMWTDVFAAPGWRTTGTAAGHFLIAPPGWRPDLSEGFDEFKLPAGTQRINAPTPYVWVIGRTKTDGPPDYDAVHKVQDGYTVTLLSEWGKEAKPAPVKIDPSVDMKTPPKTQVDTASAGAYFAYAAELLKLHPPHITDQPLLARMQRIGIESGKSFDLSKADAVVQKALETVPQDAQALMAWKVKTLARVANGWSMNTDTMGVYGNYYLKRAIIAQQGLGANLPEDAIYPLNLADENGQPLDGGNNYAIHFDKDQIPPVQAFWSVTLYDDEGFQVANSLNRFAVSSWMPFKYNADGSLDLYFQNESPGKDMEWNWLPAPQGRYNLTMRLYAPKPDALTGRWTPPPVTKASTASPLAAQ
ncbi:hypothetical protein RHEC894_CH02041 [Rhizobium sp. CIAT894]|uniref:DUF1254 domain-containing protein n=1 Tax=Rhizobium sp. CIAT894 TaxID=2020312 RepID=UPI000A1F667B|nr:DUF1254 domain-containing protein [Rhizobium sp. CIAT894]ARM88342.1 hypothetical protein RHEC894_CH02041 [Rhizobium sp. CIAT894]